MNFPFSEVITSNINIRYARPEDAMAFHDIAASLLPSNSPSTIRNDGFILFAPDTETYAKRISHSKHCYIAQDSDRIVGFLTAFTYEKRLAAGREEDPAVQAISIILGNDFVFADQLAIKRGYDRSGVGHLLWDQLIHECTDQRIAGLIAETPVRNNASIHFFIKHGMKRISEFTDDNGTRGIYLRI